jgi:hypothetical protein
MGPPLGGPGRNGAHQVAQLGGGHGPCCPNVEPKAGCGCDERSLVPHCLIAFPPHPLVV